MLSWVKIQTRIKLSKFTFILDILCTNYIYSYFEKNHQRNCLSSIHYIMCSFYPQRFIKFPEDFRSGTKHRKIYIKNCIYIKNKTKTKTGNLISQSITYTLAHSTYFQDYDLGFVDKFWIYSNLLPNFSHCITLHTISISTR